MSDTPKPYESETPETCEAVERWRQGKINIFDEMARLERERNALSFEVSRLKYQRTETEASLKKCRKELDELNHRAEIDAKINKNFIDQLIDMRTERDEAQKACVKWVKIALREASMNGSLIYGKETAK